MFPKMMEMRIRKNFVEIIFRDYLLKEFITKIILFLDDFNEKKIFNYCHQNVCLLYIYKLYTFSYMIIMSYYTV